jgi:hypothetical protein
VLCATHSETSNCSDMKKIVLLSLIVFLSCKKKSEEIGISNRVQLEEIREPKLFRDTLGLGELSIEHKILQIKRFSYGSDNYYYFDYVPGTKKLKSIFYKPASHPQSCAFSRCDFYYENNRINKIEISSPSSACEIITKSYQFDYFPIGALKSVTQIDDFNINETFFSYDTIGRIDKIFRSGRYKSDATYRFSETVIYYNLSGNVKEITAQPAYANTVSERISFTYDSAINPFKQVYILQEFLFVFGWSEGTPLFLSTNVVNQTTRTYESNSASQIFPYTVTTSNARLHQFYYFDQFGSTIYYQ